MKTPAPHCCSLARTHCVAACSKYESRREVEWAKSALARNPDFEILATDASAGVFTVRDTTSGEVRTMRLEELVAAPLPAGAAAQPERAAPAPATASELPASNRRRARRRPRCDGRPGRSNYRDWRPSSATALAATLAEGPGYSITRGTEPRGREAAPCHARRAGLQHHANRADRAPERRNARRRSDRRQRRASLRSHHLPGRSPHAHRRRDPRVLRRCADRRKGLRSLHQQRPHQRRRRRASSRARRECTSSTAPSVARAVRTKPPKARKSTWLDPRSPASAAASTPPP